MKMAVKKGYCPACRKLVRVREQKEGVELQIACTQCGRLLYANNGIKWRPVGAKVSTKIHA